MSEPKRVIYRNNDVEKLKYDHSIIPGCHTVIESFSKAVELYSEKECIQYRKVKEVEHEMVKLSDGREKEFTIPVFDDPVTITYGEYAKRVQKLSDGLITYGKLKAGDKVGIYLETRYEWFLSANAVWRHGLVLCTAYDTLGIDGLKSIIQETGITVIFIAKNKLKDLETIAGDVKTLKKVILVDPLFPEKKSKEKEEEEECPYELIPFDEVMELGKENVIKETHKSKPEDVVNIMFTSGTTGAPKGVMHTNQNIMGCTYAAWIHSNTHNDPSVVSSYVGYLPLAHIMEIAFESFVFFSGGCIKYATPRTLTDTGAKPCGDLTCFKPTCMLGVPRVFETIKKKVMMKINSKTLTTMMFAWGFSYKKDWKNVNQKTPIWDKILFNKLKNLFGGKLKFLISGGAPLSKSTHEFLQTILYPQTFFTSAYGATETCGCGLARGAESVAPLIKKGVNPYLSRSDVGWPKVVVEIALEDVPDMGYFVKDGCGEILIRGQVVSKGYFNRDEENKNNFTEDGFYRSGDIGQYNKEDGTFTIIDRKKNFMKLQNGEFISPESLEMDYISSPFVAPNGIVIIANSLSNSIIALVHPDEDYVMKMWGPANEKSIKSYEEICKSEKLNEAIMEDFKRIAKETKKLPVEVIKKISLVSDEWTVENKMVNSTQKIMRNNVKKHYKAIIDELYKDLL